MQELINHLQEENGKNELVECLTTIHGELKKNQMQNHIIIKKKKKASKPKCFQDEFM